MTSTIKHMPPPDIAAERQNTDSAILVPAEDTATGVTTGLTTEQVRQGHTGDHVRYILALSTLGIVVAFAVVYLLFFSGASG
ncbi:MAG: hypothetical protein AB7P23_02780 [Amphiplicatus sp.]